MKSLFPFVTIINNFRFACFFFSACSLSVCVCVWLVEMVQGAAAAAATVGTAATAAAGADRQTVRQSGH